ncbi:glycosyltransferase family 2 protein [Butyrivibrio sp. JL13D10]|uniref:glycosyltransferase family 2 protein n=1 Tax=Butyrivibrio sp. JL13D10 TaxID=3236815 RepID=UPI0038B44C80
MLEAEIFDKKVSVIMPVYNVEKYLLDCLNSIEQQTYSNFELIIVDDGSTDRSGDICDSFCRKNEYARVIHTDNKGVSIARNRGLDLAKGEYIVFLDSDDVLSKYYLEVLVRLMIESDEQMGLIGYSNKGSSELSNNNSILNTVCVSTDYIFDNIIRNNEIGGYLWNKIFSKKIIHNNNLQFLEGVVIWEDVYFVLQYLNSISNICWCKSKFYYYRVRETSAVMNMTLEKKRNKIWIAKKICEYEKKDCKQFHIDVERSYLRTYFDYCWTAYRSRNLSMEQKKLFLNELHNYNGKSYFSFTEKIKIVLMCLN